MIDLHSHILPGLDDGVRSLEEARELASRSAVEGITAIAATPHVRDDYPTSAAEMEAGVEALQRDLDAHGVPVQVLTGGELALERALSTPPGELRRFALGGGSRYVLVEFPYAGWPLALDHVLFSLGSHELVPLIAHPERNREVQEQPSSLEAVVSRGALVQVTAASVDGRLGKASQRAATELLELGLVDVLASDAHSFNVRMAGLGGARRALGDAGLARHLTEEAPAAIVAGEPVPERPRLRRPRRRFLRRG